MTDNEIIKALECCASEQYTCGQCPYQETKHYDYDNGFEIMPNGKQYDDWSCDRWLMTDLIALINRLQAKNEALQMDNKQLETDNFNANMNCEHLQAEIKRLKVELFDKTVQVNIAETAFENYKQIAENQQSVSMDKEVEIKRLKAEIERLQTEIKLITENSVIAKYPHCVLCGNGAIFTKSLAEYDKLIDDIATEAGKEFAERLKGKVWDADTRCGYVQVVDVGSIEDTLKEMVGEDK